MTTVGDAALGNRPTWIVPSSPGATLLLRREVAERFGYQSMTSDRCFGKVSETLVRLLESVQDLDDQQQNHCDHQ
jgi:hypothetical protein